MGAERRDGRRRGLALVAASALLIGCWAAAPSPASAAVTIGQLAPGTTVGCGNGSEHVQPSVTSGNGYAVAGEGTITSWTTRQVGQGGGTVSMKVFRPIAALTYTVVGRHGPREVANNSGVNTFAIPGGIVVRPGDVLGLYVHSGPGGCQFQVPGESHPSRTAAETPVGATVRFLSTLSNVRLNISAQVEPSNEFGLRRVKRNKKKGIAILEATLPGPGEVRLGGKGVRSKGAGARRVVSGPATVRLKLRAKKGKLKRLKRRGKAKVGARVTYTPIGGVPDTKPRPTKLLRKKKRKR